MKKRKSHFSWRWILGRKLPPNPALDHHENEVSILVRNMRESRRDSFQWWHPSLSTSFVINIIRGLVEWYRGYYFWPPRLKFAIAQSSDPTESMRRDIRIRFQKICWFRLIRLSLFAIFPTVVLFQYLFPHLSGSYLKLLISHLLVVFLFLLILVDNLLCQWSELATFLKVENMTVISIFLCQKSSRDSLWEFRMRFMTDAFGSCKEQETTCGEKFKSRLEEHVEELSRGLSSIKAEVFRLAILPLRHVFGLLVFWGVMVMSLQLHCGGQAFSNLPLESENSRTVYTFTADMVNCLYFSAGTIATNAYGEIYPEYLPGTTTAPEEQRRAASRSHLMKSPTWIRAWVLLATAVIIITILGTFNLAFRSVDVLMRSLQDPKTIEDAIKDFVSDRFVYPLIQ